MVQQVPAGQGAPAPHGPASPGGPEIATQLRGNAPVSASALTPASRDRPRHSRIAVDVTFLRMPQRPAEPAPPLPHAARIVRLPEPTVGFYRYLYGSVGHDYCWWLRRVASDVELQRLLSDPAVSLHVLDHQGEPGGFFELDAREPREVNISYFGLMPHLVGKGMGGAFLRAAIDTAWSRVRPPQAAIQGGAIRVNTCTADHPRALGFYLRAGFQPLRTVRELWNIPDELGLPIPARLRA